MESYENDGLKVEMSISEVAELLGVSQSALRYYEDQGLVQPTRDTGSGYRTYSPAALIELTDIMIYRNLGVPIKEIKSLMKAPTPETALVFDEALSRLARELGVLSKKMEALVKYSQNMHLLYSLKHSEPRFVERPKIDCIYPFNLGQAKELQAYINEPLGIRYAVHFENATESHLFTNGVMKKTHDSYEAPIWKLDKGRDRNSRFLECLLETDYYYTNRNNLDRYVEYILERELEPGYAVAKYLTFGFDPVKEKRVDYYIAWVQVVPRQTIEH